MLEREPHAFKYFREIEFPAQAESTLFLTSFYDAFLRAHVLSIVDLSTQFIGLSLFKQTFELNVSICRTESFISHNTEGEIKIRTFVSCCVTPSIF